MPSKIESITSTVKATDTTAVPTLCLFQIICNVSENVPCRILSLVPFFYKIQERKSNYFIFETQHKKKKSVHKFTVIHQTCAHL